jgi:hypothetical protein
MISDTGGWWCVYNGHEGVELYRVVQCPAPRQNVSEAHVDYWLALLTLITYCCQDVY